MANDQVTAMRKKAAQRKAKRTLLLLNRSHDFYDSFQKSELCNTPAAAVGHHHCRRRHWSCGGRYPSIKHPLIERVSRSTKWPGSFLPQRNTDDAPVKRTLSDKHT